MTDKTPRRELLEEAANLIDGDRDKDYGSPTDNFQVIAELWTARFAHKLKDGEIFTAADYADAMILAKVARNVQNAKRDNWADIAGYAGCGYETTLEQDEPTSDFPRQVVINVAVPDDVDVAKISKAIQSQLRAETEKRARGHAGL